ncbi:hypothetical protein D3C81_1642940 [compost metagenome]
MAAGRADPHQAAAGAEQTLGFGPVQRAEHAGDELAAGIGQWHAGHAGDHPGDRGITPASALDRLARDIQGVAVSRGQGLGQLRGVVAFAAADVQPGCGLALGGQFGQAPGHRGVVAGIEEVAAGFDHGLVVTWVTAVLVLHGQQVQVTLAGTVETVPGRAHHAIVEPRQGRLAERAGEHQASNRTRVW